MKLKCYDSRMDPGRILQIMNEHDVDYLLIGGLNFFLRHDPVATLDVDLWIADSEENRRRCEHALAELDAEWGKGDEDWGPVADKNPDWLNHQSVFCLLSPHGAIDIFLSVAGLADWQACASRALREEISEGVEYLGLADEDMLLCQQALEPAMQRKDRMARLQQALAGEGEYDEE